MTKGFKWNKNVVATTQKVLDQQTAKFVVYGGNFALDDNGKPITRSEEEMDSYSDLEVDNGTTYANVGHVFRGDEDICLKYFGEETEACKQHNKNQK